MVKNYVQNSSLYGVGESVVGQVRKANEDNCGHASTENGELFVVCDGMGGHVGGATASEIGVRSIIDFISRNKMDDKRVLLAEALKFANMQIYGRASEDATLKGMGTTACIVLIQADDIWLAHVGDSRIYLYSAADKFLYRITKDHSFVQGLVDSGQLDDRDAENHPQKNIIMRALGIKEDMKPEVAPEPMHCAKGDIIMICSDGLSGMIDDVHIEKKIRENKADLADLCQQLIDDANTPDKGKDNITCQLIRIEASAVAAPVHPDYTPKWRRGGLKGIVAAVTGGTAKPNDEVLAPKPASKLWLWISLTILVLLIGGAIATTAIYISNHRHVFRPNYQKAFVQESDDVEGFNMNDQLRRGAEAILWTVTTSGVKIDAKGYLTVDSTYVEETKTCIKVKAKYNGKEYQDSIYMHLEYIKEEKELVTTPEPTPGPIQEPEQTLNPTPTQNPVQTASPATKTENPKKPVQQKEQPPAPEKPKATKFVVQFCPTKGKANVTDPDRTKQKDFTQSGEFGLDTEGKYLVCIVANGAPVTPPDNAFTLSSTAGIKRSKVVNGWYQIWTDETYKGDASLFVRYEGSTIKIKLPIKQ